MRAGLWVVVLLATVPVAGCVGQPSTTLVRLAETEFIFIEKYDQIVVGQNTTPPLPGSDLVLEVNTPKTYVTNGWEANITSGQELRPGFRHTLTTGALMKGARYAFCHHSWDVEGVEVKLTVRTETEKYVFDSVRACPGTGGA